MELSRKDEEAILAEFEERMYRTVQYKSVISEGQITLLIHRIKQKLGHKAELFDCLTASIFPKQSKTRQQQCATRDSEPPQVEEHRAKPDEADDILPKEVPSGAATDDDDDLKCFDDEPPQGKTQAQCDPSSEVASAKQYPAQEFKALESHTKTAQRYASHLDTPEPKQTSTEVLSSDQQSGEQSDGEECCMGRLLELSLPVMGVCMVGEYEPREVKFTSKCDQYRIKARHVLYKSKRTPLEWLLPSVEYHLQADTWGQARRIVAMLSQYSHNSNTPHQGTPQRE